MAHIGDTPWIWNSRWVESPTSASAGGFVHFRKCIELDNVPSGPVHIAITADTRYKLYINSILVHAGPVKGDQTAWFYDVLDIQPFLRVGRNHVAANVLRFYYASKRASSFARTGFPGFYIQPEPTASSLTHELPEIQTDASWQTAIDPCITLPTEKNLDFYLNTFEEVDRRKQSALDWIPATPYRFKTNYGMRTPWNLCKRMVPPHELRPGHLKAVHNVQSTLSPEGWATLINPQAKQDAHTLVLPKGTKHHVEFEVEQYTTAYVKFRFARPMLGGSILDVTWCERYSDTPNKTQFPQNKGDRADTRGYIIGFEDRAFRFFSVDIEVAPEEDVILKGIEFDTTNYPLQVSASLSEIDLFDNDSTLAQKLWDVSLHTLKNCMHDTYEDCPYFEQLQYSMDTRSCALFTYLLSRDDRLARQAIFQFYNSYQPTIGLLAARTPCHILSVISHFSLFWVCMVTDHFEYFGDSSLAEKCLPIIDAVPHTFRANIDTDTGLIKASICDGDWPFVDASEAYEPTGVPPAGEDTGFMTFTSQLVAYSLQRLAFMELCIGKAARASEHTELADSLVKSVRQHCFDGEYFTDGLACKAQPNHYSEHSQIWAVLCGASRGHDVVRLLKSSLGIGDTQVTRSEAKNFSKVSTSMAFYSLRALSVVDNELYYDHFDKFWDPWRYQLSLNVTTWIEELIKQRSDCHAWNSLPLYEFPAEIAGLRPVMSSGRRMLLFKPRIRFCKNFDATLPVSGTVENPVMAHVQWFTTQDGMAVVSLAWGDHEAQNIQQIHLLPVQVILPYGQEEVLELFENKQWTVALPSI